MEESADVSASLEKKVDTSLTLVPIAYPLAGRKLTKKIFKLVKKAANEKAIKRGVKEVAKGIRKGENGLCVIAGDISPMDVITHLPILCEDHNIPYIWVPSRQALGAASQTKRPTSCILIALKPQSELIKLLQELEEEVKSIAPLF